MSEAIKSDNAAEDLLNITLDSGWVVKEKLEKVPGQTGAFFSVCYLIEKEGKQAFLKALNFSKFMEIAEEGTAVVDSLTDMLNIHKYEKSLSELCQKKHLDKIVVVKDAGEILLKGYAYSLVPYLIFDLADGDVRKKMFFANNLDIIWKLKSLHSICVGLKQLHGIHVSHQDLKPSNVLVFGEESKIGDIGNSLCQNLPSPFDGAQFTGDRNYAPPEILYGVYEADWKIRTHSADCYLLGSMIVFYFTGMSMTAIIRDYLPDNFSWEYWTGSYDDVIDHVNDAYYKAIQDLEKNISDSYLREELSKLVKYLCNPLPSKRGYPRNLNDSINQYSLEQFVTKLDVLHQKAKYNLIKA